LAKKEDKKERKAGLLERIKANSTIKETEILSESKFFNDKGFIPTPVPIISGALSGDLDGGLGSGLLVIAAHSRHFKTAFALLLGASFLEKNPDGVVLFYDSEFGTPLSYFDSFGVNKDRVLHSPITDIEQLKFDVMQQLGGLERGDKVMVIVDSLGNLASKKEVEDAMKGSSAADMTRARQIKSLFRMVTPHLTLKDIPMVIVNHIYMTMDLFPKPVISGGSGVLLSADNAWIIGRQQDKDGDGLQGYNFIINIEKSRYVKEKSKFPVHVTFAGGISKWSGLLDLAIEAGYLVNSSPGWVEWIDPFTGELMSEKKLQKKTIEDSSEFWEDFLGRTSFKDWFRDRFKLGKVKMIASDGDAEQAAEPTAVDLTEDE
jgi:RecA/RadA recombinase